MENTDAPAVAQTAEDQNPSEISNQETSEKSISETVKEDENSLASDSTNTEDNSDAESEQEEADGDKPEPFHNHPRFKKITRENRKMKSQMKDQSSLIKDMKETLEEIKAMQSGEEYTPKEGNLDPEAIFNDELDGLVDELDLDVDVEDEVRDIAEKYAMDMGGDKKFLLPAKVAHQIYKDMQAGKEVKSTPKKPSTKPSKKVTESSASKLAPQGGEREMSLSEIAAKSIARANQMTFE